MKKLFAIALTAAMTLSMATSAFATSGTETGMKDGSKKDIPVSAKFFNGQTTGKQISVDVTWGEMEFTYSIGGNKVWNAGSHTYTVENATSGWTATGNEVKVVNHSNVDVKATFTYTPESGNALTGTFAFDNNKTTDNGTISLAAGEENKPLEADNVTATLSLTGTPSSGYTDFTKVGTVTVKIEEAK